MMSVPPPAPKGTISVQAQGRLPDAKSKAKSVAQQRLDGLLDAYLGWTLLGFWIADLRIRYQRVYDKATGLED